MHTYNDRIICETLHESVSIFNVPAILHALIQIRKMLDVISRNDAGLRLLEGAI